MMRRASKLRIGFWLAGSLVVVLWWGIDSSYAIEVQPTADQIQATVERGKQAAAEGLSPEQLHSWFGAGEDLARAASS